MKRILIVDDHKAIVAGIKMLLENNEMHVTACYSGCEALEILSEQSFDLMLFDLSMPDMDGMTLTKKTITLYPEAIILIFSGTNLSLVSKTLIQMGIRGIIDKTCSDKQLIMSINMVLQNMVVFPVDCMPRDTILHFKKYDDEPMPLSKFEITLLQLAAQGKTNKEISSELNTVQRNIEYHFSKIYEKLNVPSRVKALHEARKRNLISI